MNCYLTGELITENNESLEHIIPNALGGKIKSKTVLTEDANTKILKDLDVAFNMIFEPFYRRLPLQKDRTVKTGLVGIHEKYNQEIVWKENKCFPRKPIFDSEKKTIYAQTLKIGNGYLYKLIKENKVQKEDDIKIFTDLSGTVEFNFKIDNNIFPKGFAKIASGYASYCGVDRQELTGVLDFERKIFRDEIALIPYYPASIQEMFAERNFLKSQHVPIHSLVLKGSKTDGLLYCYVELFSAFQYIVILNAKYKGEDIYKTYLFDLLASKEISYAEYVDSIVDEEMIKKILPRYRDFNFETIEFMVDVAKNKNELLKRYCHKKYRDVESLIAYIELQEKMELLDRKFNG